MKEVSEYKYLGMLVAKAFSWRKQKDKMWRDARRKMAYAWSMLWRAGYFSVKAGISVWNALIRPSLEYGAEIWNSEDDMIWHEAELLQREMARRVLGCGKTVTTEALMGELGWVPLLARRKMLRIRFWGKIERMKADRWVKRVYEESRRQFEEDPSMKNWCSLTCRWMREAGLGEVWTRRDASGDMIGWKETVKNAVMEQESAVWRSAVLGKPKLEPVYAHVKKILEYEDYLDHPDVEGRRILLGMRSGTNGLRVDTGRWEFVVVLGKKTRLPRSLRVCQVCFDGVEDEMHFVLDCPGYAVEREDMFRGLDVSDTSPGAVARRMRWCVEGGGKEVAMCFLRKAMEKRKKVFMLGV